MGAVGLQTHIWNNNLKSMLLLAGFPVLLGVLTYALFLLFAGVVGVDPGTGAAIVDPFVWSARAAASAWPFALIGAGLWFAIAYLAHQAIIDGAMGARTVERSQEPRLYNLLENLAISRGMRMPALRIIESPARNAYASGLHEGRYAVTVTRGLLQALDEAELEAVLAHELTHIINKDVRLLVIAAIFVGVFSFVGELAFRVMTRARFHAGGRRSSSRDSGGGAAIAILVALALIALSYALAVALRFALSRRREYLADAGAVELTKNPDAMISALRKVQGGAAIPDAPAEIREMFFENAHAGLASLFATHPPIEKRIEALVRYAGGRDAPPSLEPTSPRPWG